MEKHRKERTGIRKTAKRDEDKRKTGKIET
jgi:hypothetical protein